MKKIKLCALLLVVILNLMFVSSCWVAAYLPYQPDKPFESGWVRCNQRFPSNAYLLVKSEKNIFDIDDVNLELYIGLVIVKDVDGQEYLDVKKFFPAYDEEVISSVPYSINTVFFEYSTNEQGKEEITVFHENILKDINIKDVFDGKYDYEINEDSYDYIYNYSETIIISKECFDKESGEFCIGVKIDYLYSVLIYFRYNKLDENTIQIEFHYENYSQNTNIDAKNARCIEAIKKYYLDKHNEEPEK